MKRALTIFALIFIAFVLAALLLVTFRGRFFPKLFTKHPPVSGVAERSSATASPSGFVGGQLMKEREKWAKRIDEIGPARAHAEFKDAARDAGRERQHTLAHLFGELLYEKAGVVGLSACDQSYDFGCYHSFFGIAVESLGVDVLPAFDRACKERFGRAYLPCQHGIGHGILVFTGVNNLEKALELCTKLSWQPTGGCGSGVYMEYNFRTMSNAASGGSYVRPLERDDPYAPCAALPEKFREGCYSEMPQWWESVFGGDHRRIGSLCGALKEAVLRESCFHGAGTYAAAFVHNDVGKIIKLCNTMPAQGRGFCREGASWIVRGSDGNTDTAITLCAGLPSVEEIRCKDRLAAN